MKLSHSTRCRDDHCDFHDLLSDHEVFGRHYLLLDCSRHEDRVSIQHQHCPYLALGSLSLVLLSSRQCAGGYQHQLRMICRSPKYLCDAAADSAGK